MDCAPNYCAQGGRNTECHTHKRHHTRAIGSTKKILHKRSADRDAGCTSCTLNGPGDSERDNVIGKCCKHRAESRTAQASQQHWPAAKPIRQRSV